MRRSLVVLTVLASLVPAGPARADGGPSPGVANGGTGVEGANGVRYVALAGARETIVAAVDSATGSVDNWRSLPGFLGVPVVAFDGAIEGLSADGSVLVLAGTASGRPERTRFVTLNPRNLKVRRSFVLRGEFAYDALSPDGRMLYLIEHLSQGEPRYLVRGYDLAAGRLLPQAIRDPREREKTMHGYPLARATSADGRWVYTLYTQTDVHTFVHALDTVGRRARCIDLPGGRSSLGAMELDLSDDGRELVALDDAGEPLAVIDTERLEVREERETAALQVRIAVTMLRRLV